MKILNIKFEKIVADLGKDGKVKKEEYKTKAGKKMFKFFRPVRVKNTDLVQSKVTQFLIFPPLSSSQ